MVGFKRRFFCPKFTENVAAEKVILQLLHLNLAIFLESEALRKNPDLIGSFRRSQFKLGHFRFIPTVRQEKYQF
jgi:hypothetical protein